MKSVRRYNQTMLHRGTADTLRTTENSKHAVVLGLIAMAPWGPGPRQLLTLQGMILVLEKGKPWISPALRTKQWMWVWRWGARRPGDTTMDILSILVLSEHGGRWAHCGASADGSRQRSRVPGLEYLSLHLGRKWVRSSCKETEPVQ